jgi:oxygen-independent coproporphyrinogen-3 oxidase
VKITADAGISNISIDLMYDIPGQTLLSWEKTLEQIASLPMNHLSLYNLTIEPNTVFFKYRESLQKIVPDPECSASMYKMAVAGLKELGLEQYEISAFARNGMFSKHNVGYWTGRPFLGFGPSAFSYWNDKRFRSVAQFNRYLEALQNDLSPIDFSEELKPKERRNELLAIGLRLKAGVDCISFEAKHGPLDQTTYIALESLVQQKLLAKKDSRYFLTDQGVLFYDTVAVEII